MPAVVVVEKKAKRQIKKRGGKCAVRSASASVTSVSSASASVASASASEYYVASYTEAVSSAWVQPSQSASPAAASATLNVQQAAVSSVEPSSSSHSSVAPTSTVAPSTTAQATSSAPATTSAASESGDWKTGGHGESFFPIFRVDLELTSYLQLPTSIRTVTPEPVDGTSPIQTC
jgi:hypothetical protein